MTNENEKSIVDDWNANVLIGTKVKFTPSECDNYFWPHADTVTTSRAWYDKNLKIAAVRLQHVGVVPLREVEVSE